VRRSRSFAATTTAGSQCLASFATARTGKDDSSVDHRVVRDFVVSPTWVRMLSASPTRSRRSRSVSYCGRGISTTLGEVVTTATKRAGFAPSTHEWAPPVASTTLDHPVADVSAQMPCSDGAPERSLTGTWSKTFGVRDERSGVELAPRLLGPGANHSGGSSRRARRGGEKLDRCERVHDRDVGGDEGGAAVVHRSARAATSPEAITTAWRHARHRLARRPTSRCENCGALREPSGWRCDPGSPSPTRRDVAAKRRRLDVQTLPTRRRRRRLSAVKGTRIETCRDTRRRAGRGAGPVTSPARPAAR